MLYGRHGGQADVVKALVAKARTLTSRKPNTADRHQMADAKGKLPSSNFSTTESRNADGGARPFQAPLRDLDDQLLDAAREGNAAKVKELLAKGQPGRHERGRYHCLTRRARLRRDPDPSRRRATQVRNPPQSSPKSNPSK